ncbi:MAG TPA: undecaprenyl-diphosphate phosphatase, partial [Spirochaetia bacterium]|nr:undecaprenyl-diphosphate phosphatase [Spirochaetia bacterium]
MHVVIIAITAIIQGVTELLPIFSSAHVIVLERLLGLDPTSPQMTFLLVMLHTGRTIAVLMA